jgi:hypothetical protein
MSHAWHVAALLRAKKLPKHETLMHRSAKAKKSQTWQEQMAIWSMIVKGVKG